METLIGASVFVLTLLLICGGYLLVKKIYKPEQREVYRRLRFLSMAGGSETIDIAKKKILSEIPWLNRKLLKATFLVRLERLRDEANAPHPLGVYMLFSAGLFFAGFLPAKVMRIDLFAVALPSLLLATTPFFFLSYKRKKRMEKFERQLPEALELLARALKAGHAFTGGLRLVAEEFADPAGPEFKKALDEINFGIGVPEALMNLTHRIDSEDLKFFVVSVVVQRETGGNLAEILENLSRLIRERFKFHGHVRVLSAEGKMSAMVLVAMPFVVVGIFYLGNPEYIKVLFSDPLGTVIIAAGLTMMGFGSLVIKKLVAIKA